MYADPDSIRIFRSIFSTNNRTSLRTEKIFINLSNTLTSWFIPVSSEMTDDEILNPRGYELLSLIGEARF